MKIAHVVCTFPPDIGGMGQVAFEEATRLQKLGHEVVVFTLHHANEYHDASLLFKVVRLTTPLKAGDAGFVPFIKKQLKAFDLIHLHYPWYGAEVVAFCDKPMVVTYHMDARPSGLIKRFVQKVADAVFGRKIFKQAAKVLAVDHDHFLSTTFSKLIDAQKVVTLPNAVDADMFKPRESSLSDFNLSTWQGKKILLFVGNMLPGKRLDLLFEALAVSNDPDLRLLVVGGGYAEAGYKEVVNRLGLEDKVHLVGRITEHEKLAGYYALADAVVVPSDEESFSLVALEAMAAGKPIIVSNVPGLRRRIAQGQFGLLFQKGSVDSLSGAIKHLFALPLEVRKQMGENGRKRVEEEYTWEKHMSRLIEVYTSVV